MTVSITLPARARAQLTAEGIRVARGGRTVLDGLTMTVSPRSRWGVVGENGRGKTTLLHVLSGALAPDEGEVRRVGTFGIAEQNMPAGESATVGDAVDRELADARAALRALDAATGALTDGRPGADEDYAAALDAAEALGAWDADRRVDLALRNLGAVTDRARGLRELSVGSATASASPACSGPSTTSCSLTSRRTTWTRRAWRSSPRGCAGTRAGSSSSATTARCWRTSRPPSSTSTRARTGARASTGTGSPGTGRAARPSCGGGRPSTSGSGPSMCASPATCPRRGTGS